MTLNNNFDDDDDDDHNHDIQTKTRTGRPKKEGEVGDGTIIEEEDNNNIMAKPALNTINDNSVTKRSSSIIDDSERCPEEKGPVQQPQKDSSVKKKAWWIRCCTIQKNHCHSLHAIFRSMIEVDTTTINVVPGIRTAIILMLEWSLMGIGRSESTPFQLTTLFVGLTDPNRSLGKRLRYMGLTCIMVFVFGSVLPGLVWESKLANLSVAAVVALLTGYSPLLGSTALFVAMKLATALFAVNGGVNRSTNGFSDVDGGQETFVLYALLGGSVSLFAALLPELIGTRDALRSNLFQFFFGFSRVLERWRSKIGTPEKMRSVPVPTIAVAIFKMETIIVKDVMAEDTA